MDLDFGSLIVYLPFLVAATWMTIYLAVVSQVIGTVAGLLLALARMSPRFVLRYPALLYIWVARGTPALIHLFFIYFALPTIGISFDPVPAAIIAFSISSSAYNAEILRAGLTAVAPGQIEAARAVGMARAQERQDPARSDARVATEETLARILVARALLNAACRGPATAEAVQAQLDDDLQRASLALTAAARDAIAIEVKDAVARGIARCRPKPSKAEGAGP